MTKKSVEKLGEVVVVKGSKKIQQKPQYRRSKPSTKSVTITAKTRNQATSDTMVKLCQVKFWDPTFKFIEFFFINIYQHVQGTTLSREIKFIWFDLTPLPHFQRTIPIKLKQISSFRCKRETIFMTGTEHIYLGIACLRLSRTAPVSMLTHDRPRSTVPFLWFQKHLWQMVVRRPFRRPVIISTEHHSSKTRWTILATIQEVWRKTSFGFLKATPQI